MTTRILGVDEAGRGCVLGALAVGGFLYVGDDVTVLTEAGATDSKKLSAKKRQAAREALASLGTPDVRMIEPAAIDQGNLNALEEEAVIDLIKTHDPDTVFLDALGHPRTLPALEARLRAALGAKGSTIQFIIEPKADLNHPPVGAASIFAKTDRDAKLAAETEPFGDLGSGYPSDPKTKAWLAVWSASGEPWPSFVRTRWETVTRFDQQRMFNQTDA